MCDRAEEGSDLRVVESSDGLVVRGDGGIEVLPLSNPDLDTCHVNSAGPTACRFELGKHSPCQ